MIGFQQAALGKFVVWVDAATEEQVNADTIGPLAEFREDELDVVAGAAEITPIDIDGLAVFRFVPLRERAAEFEPHSLPMRRNDNEMLRRPRLDGAQSQKQNERRQLRESSSLVVH